jgi:hypothetical protein
MCSVGACFLIGRKLWKQYFANASAQDAKATNPEPVQPQDEVLRCFDGSPADAFDAMMDKVQATEHQFMQLHQLMDNSVKLYDNDDATLFQKGATLANTFAAFFGAQSCFCKRFHDLRCDKDLRFQPPHPLIAEGAPWGAVNTLSCNVSVPVLGMCKYEEVNRFALCREKAQTTLAVQRVGKLRAGLYGTLPAELLYLFTQGDNDDTVHMQVFAVSPTGRFATAALESFRKSVQDFCTVAREVMQDRSKNCTSHADCKISGEASEQRDASKIEDMFTLLDYQVY